MSVQVYDRLEKTVREESQYGEKRLQFLYETATGRLLLQAIFARRWYSKLSAIKDKSRYSVSKVESLIDQFDIDMSEYLETHYSSYDSFIIRTIDPAKRPVVLDPAALVAVADSKLLAYPVTPDGCIPVKHTSYTVTELLRDAELASTYNGGICLVFRLGTEDYHRYCFADDGTVTRRYATKGILHSVQPISSKRYRAFSENQRECSIIETVNFGTMVVVEVGALLVGKIHNHNVTSCRRGQEKGYFSLGGSTILLLLSPSIIEVDADIMEHSQQHIETKVRLGEQIGVRAGTSLPRP